MKTRSLSGLFLPVAVLLALSLSAPPTVAAEPSVITLRDGSIIRGELVSLIGGLYTVQSTTLGAITVRESDIRGVTQGDAAPSSAPAPAPSQIDDVQQRMVADPEAMKAVQALQDSPEVKELLSDPEVLKALQSGNLEFLLANPKLARLAADPKVQEITRKFAE